MVVDDPRVDKLRAAVEALDFVEAAPLMTQMAAWGLEDDKAREIWCRMQAARKGPHPWHKQKRKLSEGEEEEEDPEEEEEEEEVDFGEEEWQVAATDEIFGEGNHLPHKYEVARVVKLGHYEGGRAERPAPTEVPFDAMVTAREGFGVSLGPKGDVYLGRWSGNKRHGPGAMAYAKGGIFVGEWVEGLRHGSGKMQYPDGSLYEGAWAYGKRHGKGTLTHANGDSYVGQFFSGVKEGDGVYRASAAGTRFEAKFLKGDIAAGKVVAADGSAYYGAFKRGAADGPGVWALSNGVLAEGSFEGKPPEDADPEDEDVKLEYEWKGAATKSQGADDAPALTTRFVVAKKPLKVVIAGPPAGGKGTQCEMIKEKFGILHIGTGDLLRAAAEDEENEIGQQAKEKMEAGELVPDHLICELLKQEMDKPEAQSGWLLDGFPRTASQVEAMKKMFIVPNKVIMLQVPDEALLGRVIGRRLDPETGKIYHVETNPVPDGEDKEAIEARLITREDDTEDKFSKRIASYHENEQALKDSYPDAKVLDGNRPPDDMPASLTKVPASSLYVSEPPPHYFGNPPNVRTARWDEDNWLKSRFHFSFAEYTSEKNNFGALRVLNDDRVQPERGFGTHPHRDMEIVTYIVEGELTHQDSMGTAETLGRGSVQFMTAGTGVRHSEHNLNPEKPLRFIQVWIVPSERGLTPNYGSASSTLEERRNRWAHMAGSTKEKHGAHVSINQDANVYVAEIEAAKSLAFHLRAGRQAYFLCMEGSANVNGAGAAREFDGDAVTFDRYDAAEVVAEREDAQLHVSASNQGAHCLVIDLKAP